MIYGLQRYYKIWNPKAGPNYFIIDRNTGEKIADKQMADDADTFVRELNQKDRKEKGLKELDEIEIPTNFGGRVDRTPREIAPMEKHK